MRSKRGRTRCLAVITWFGQTVDAFETNAASETQESNHRGTRPRDRCKMTRRAQDRQRRPSWGDCTDCAGDDRRQTIAVRKRKIVCLIF